MVSLGKLGRREGSGGAADNRMDWRRGIGSEGVRFIQRSRVSTKGHKTLSQRW